MKIRRVPLWLTILVVGAVLLMAGGRSLLWGGGGVAGVVLTVLGVGMLVVGEVLRRRRARSGFRRDS